MAGKVPDIRFKGFSDGWEQRKLSTFADRFDNLREPITAGKRVNGDTPYYGANGIQDYVDGYTHDGDFLLIAEDGANDLSNYPVRRVNGKVWVNNHAHVVAGKMDEADNGFLANSFKTINIEPFLVGGGRAKLNSDVMMKLEFKLPEYQEQKEIGSLLGNVDDLLTLHQRKLSQLEKFKSSLLQNLFPKNGATNPSVRFGEFTNDWEQRKVSDIFQVTRGHVLSAKAVSPIKTDSNPYPVYSSQTKNNGLMGYYNEYLFNNAITWTTDGANAGTVNYRPGQFYSTNVNGVLLSNDGYVNKAVAESLDKVSYKFVSHVGNPKLMNNVMSEIIINIPSEIAEQARMSELLIDLDHSVTLHQRKLDRLDELKKLLLQKMFI